MKVTITRDYAKAVFTWSDDLQDCHLTSYGFEDDEIDALMAAKAHEGKLTEGYTVEIE